MADPYVGKLTYFRVYSGTLQAGAKVLNASTGRTERVGRILEMHANHREEREEIYAGDIVAGVGLKQTSTGDTLCDPAAPIKLETIEFPEPVISVSIEPKTKADQEKLGTALAPPGRGGPDLPGAHRRGDRADADLRDGRAAPRGDRRPHAARVQGGRQRRPPAGRLPRDGAPAGREGRGALRAPDRRPRPVRPRRDQPRAGPRRGLRLRQQDQGRLDSLRVHPGGRAGHRGGARDGRQGRLPDGRRARHAHRRLLPRRRLLGDGLQDRRVDGLPGGRAPGEARPARADHGRRGRHARGVHGRRDRRPEPPPRADRGHGAARQRPGDQGLRAARRDVRLRDRPALTDAGPGHLHDAVRALRGGPRGLAEEITEHRSGHTRWAPTRKPWAAGCSGPASRGRAPRRIPAIFSRLARAPPRRRAPALAGLPPFVQSRSRS